MKNALLIVLACLVVVLIQVAISCAPARSAAPQQNRIFVVQDKGVRLVEAPTRPNFDTVTQHKFGKIECYTYREEIWCLEVTE